jgi:hypothetical protein
MPMQPGKRTIVYNLPPDMTLGNFRRIVEETQSLRDDTKVMLPHSMGQRDDEHFKFVLEEIWPAS